MTIELEEARQKREAELKMIKEEEEKRRKGEEERKRKEAEEAAAKNVIVEVEEIFEVTKELFLIMDERFGARVRIPINMAQFTSELPGTLTDEERNYILELADRHISENKLSLFTLMKELKAELPTEELEEVDNMKVAKKREQNVVSRARSRRGGTQLEEDLKNPNSRASIRRMSSDMNSLGARSSALKRSHT